MPLHVVYRDDGNVPDVRERPREVDTNPQGRFEAGSGGHCDEVDVWLSVPLEERDERFAQGRFAVEDGVELPSLFGAYRGGRRRKPRFGKCLLEHRHEGLCVLALRDCGEDPAVLAVDVYLREERVPEDAVCRVGEITRRLDEGDGGFVTRSLYA